MSRKKPIDNSDYTYIFLFIFNGIKTPKTLRRELHKKTPLGIPSKSNLSMKLQTLKKLGFIENERLRSISKSSTSRYSLNYNGIQIYVFSNILKISPPKSLNFIFKNMFKLYLLNILRNKLEPPSLKKLFTSFIEGIALFQQDLFIKYIKTGQDPPFSQMGNYNELIIPVEFYEIRRENDLLADLTRKLFTSCLGKKDKEMFELLSKETDLF